MPDVQVKCGGRWLALDGAVDDLEFTSAWRHDAYCGDLEASWKFDFPWTNTPGFLSRGARVEIYLGGSKRWGGILSEPSRGNPWEMSAIGLGAELSRYLALEQVEYGDDTLTVPSHKPDAAFDLAVERGMPLWRSTSLGNVPVKEDKADPETEHEILFLDELLMRRAKQLGKRLHVGVDGHVSFVDDPTTVGWHVHPDIAYMGTADPEYVTHLYGLYIYDGDVQVDPPKFKDATAYNMVVAADPAAELRWGRVERALDLTALGWLGFNKNNPAASSPSIATIEASEFVQGRFKQVGARMAYTNSFEVDDQLLTFTSGAQGEPADVRAGQLMRMFGVLDAAGDLKSGSAADIIAGQVTYQAASRTARIQPLGFTPRGFNQALTNPEAPSEERVETP